MRKTLLVLCVYCFSQSISFAQTTCGSFMKIAKGVVPNFTVAIKTDGTLWAWGDNSDGQLGDGTFINKSIPTRIGTSNNWVMAVCGVAHTVAIKSDGTLWAWGYNFFGQLGDGTTIGKNVPTQIGTASNWLSIAASYSHTIALKQDGSLWAWGYNNYGQLGDGSTNQKLIPTQIGTNTDWISIACGYDYSTALKSNGTLFAWGYNAYGQLGDGTTNDKPIPTQVGTSNNWSSITCGYYHTISTKQDGTLWAWGENSFGELGDGTTINKSSPIQIGVATNWTNNIAGGTGHTIAIKQDGTLWAWGHNFFNQLGDGTSINKITPTQIGVNTNWSLLAAGSNHSASIKQDGTLLTWGYNAYGQLGDATSNPRSTPTQISTNNTVTLATTNVTQALPINGPLTMFFNAPNCNNLITSVAPSGTSSISGSATSKVWIESTQPAQFVTRHYEIVPSSNATTATGRVTLYFTQAEFNAFNNQVPAPALLLPQNITDATGKANLRIERRNGTSSNNTGLPATYSLTGITTIDPNDADIVWNATANRWEVTFDVTGFGGFFAKTFAFALPVQWLSVNGNINSQKQAVINWQVQEQNVSNYNIEKSNDGRSFITITNVGSKGNGINNYQFTDAAMVSGINYYRIQQVDKDGKLNYSSVVKLSNTISSSITLYPVPAKEHLTISLNNSQLLNTEFVILNSVGNRVVSSKITNQVQQVNISRLATGIYCIKFSDGIVQKFVKE